MSSGPTHLMTVDQILDLMELRFMQEYATDVKCEAKRKYDVNRAYAEIASPVRHNGPYMWITVNPMAEIRPEMVVKKAHKAFKKKWINYALYSLEQRSEELPYKGYHIHCILNKGTKSPYEALREFKSTFKTICDTSNPACLHVRYFEEDQARDKAAYLLGLKRTDKLAKVEMDKKMRTNFGWPDYWTSNAVPQILLEPRE